MKLRITNSSVRLRLTRSDVERFRETGVIEEVLRLGPSLDDTFSYILSRGSEKPAVSATLTNKRLIVMIPEKEAADWTGSEKVGVEGSQANSDGSTVSILIEKDFACLTPRAGDDDKDTFPHPNAPKNC